jgi:hypothetical protein
MKRHSFIRTALFIVLTVLAGCAHSKQESVGPAIDDIEAIGIASAAAEKGGWEVLDVRDPKRVKSGWKVFVMRKEKGAVEPSPVEVVISADGKTTRLVYPNVPNIRDDLNRSKPIRRMSPQ